MLSCVAPRACGSGSTVTKGFAVAVWKAWLRLNVYYNIVPFWGPLIVCVRKTPYKIILVQIFCALLQIYSQTLVQMMPAVTKTAIGTHISTYMCCRSKIFTTLKQNKNVLLEVADSVPSVETSLQGCRDAEENLTGVDLF